MNKSLKKTGSVIHTCIASIGRLNGSLREHNLQMRAHAYSALVTVKSCQHNTHCHFVQALLYLFSLHFNPPQVSHVQLLQTLPMGSLKILMAWQFSPTLECCSIVAMTKQYHPVWPTWWHAEWMTMDNCIGMVQTTCQFVLRVRVSDAVGHRHGVLMLFFQWDCISVLQWGFVLTPGN